MIGRKGSFTLPPSASPRQQRGITLVVGIFVLVVLAGLAAFLATLATVQHQSVAFGVEGSRVLAAARSGVELKAWRVMENDDACEDRDFELEESAAAGIAVSIGCSSSSHDERGEALTLYHVTATAERGSYGDPYYIRRAYSATFVEGDE